MINMKLTIKRPKKGYIKAVADRIVSEVILKAGTRIIEGGVDAAKVTYLEKKKHTPKMPSFIFDSFKIDKNLSLPKSASFVGYCDEAIAPHWIFVDKDRPLVNGQMWSEVNPKAPYEFIAEGNQFIEDNADRIVKEEIARAVKK